MKRILTLILLVSVLVLPSVLATPQSRNETQNDTYLDMGATIILRAEGHPTNWTSVTNVALDNFSIDLQDMTTNMTRWDDVCCIYMADKGVDKIIVFNNSGDNVQNLSMPSEITNPAGLWTNASGESVTDFWVTDYTTDRVYHLNSTGGNSTDPTGNFNTTPNTTTPISLWSNRSSGVPTEFFIVDNSLKHIVIFSTTGEVLRGLPFPSAVGNPCGISSNETDMSPTQFWISDYTNDEIYHSDSSGNIIEHWDVAGDGLNNPRKALIFKGAVQVNETIVNDDTTEDFFRYRHGHLDYAILETNETGTWENKTGTYSPQFSGHTWNWNTSVFSWSNSSENCNVRVGWRVYFNDTLGRENVSAINTFIHMPWIEDASWGVANVSSVTCEDKNNMTLTLTDVPSGWFRVNMSFVHFDSTDECAYNVTGVNQVNITNSSESCLLNISHADLAASAEVKVYKFSGLRFEAPANIPSGIAIASVAVIIVIGYIVAKSKNVSW